MATSGSYSFMSSVDDLATATHVLYAPTASADLGYNLGYDLFEAGRAVASAAASTASS